MSTPPHLVTAERREEDVSEEAASLNSNGKIAAVPATSRWMRVAKIVVLSTLVGPAIAGVLLFVELVVVGPYQGVHLYYLLIAGPDLMAQSYAFGAPYALITSGGFALVAVLKCWRQLVVAVAISLVPAAFFLVVVSVVENQARNTLALLWVTAFIVIPITTAVCWYLSRRWHSPNI